MLPWPVCTTPPLACGKTSACASFCPKCVRYWPPLGRAWSMTWSTSAAIWWRKPCALRQRHGVCARPTPARERDYTPGQLIFGPGAGVARRSVQLSRNADPAAGLRRDPYPWHQRRAAGYSGPVIFWPRPALCHDAGQDNARPQAAVRPSPWAWSGAGLFRHGPPWPGPVGSGLERRRLRLYRH